tara:strand:- start:1152 stop:1541 length:390 start_codon:yes stop_codon:yes gene_type:complete
MDTQDKLLPADEAAAADAEEAKSATDDFHPMEETAESTPTCKGQLKDLEPEDIDNEYILTFYRINFNGIRKVLSTMFMMHNETFNVWSHFVGSLFYLGIAITILVSIPDMSDVGMDALIQKQYSATPQH